MSFAPLQPARLTFTPDGTPKSEAYDDIYHSADGGPGQAQQVFLHGNGLPQNWAGKSRFTILENGFGSGLNFLATWAAWRADPARPQTLHYLATERHPFQIDDLAKLHKAWQQLEFLAEALRTAWPTLLPGMHRLEFAAGRVVLTLLLGDAETSLRQLRASVDAFYLDGFDPQKNPQMWAPSLLKRCGQLAAPDATFATWCVAGQVRRALSEAGFAVEKRPGFGSKRQMLVGRLIARRTPVVPAQSPKAKQAAVIGAGLAGCAIAERLAARGWQVDLFERNTTPANEASGNLAGIARPLLSRDDNLASRLNRACFLYLQQSLRRLDQAGFPPRRKLDGILQIAHDAEHEAQQRIWLEANGFPADFVRFVEREPASRMLNAETALGGWWFPAGGWANPPSLCRAWLSAGGGNIHFHGGSDIARLRQTETGWQLLDADAQTFAEAPVVIFATGAQTAENALSQIARLPILPVRGQVSHLPAGSLPMLKHAACCEGYLTPAVNDVHCLGASYAKDASSQLRVTEHEENLLRLSRILPGTEQNFDARQLNGRVGFRATTPDHLPLVGALPDLDANLAGDIRLQRFPRHAGLYGLLGLGSRGLVWAALLAEHLASIIGEEPLPLPGDQTDAIDPARFALRAHRHVQG
jgi:tRNA 5-methylaminomethyl-2-thiouridine biosynthesis bifunctional protein